MSWQKEVDELGDRRQFALQMGGPEGVARQKRRGKLTVRERIAAIADEGSFEEFMGLMGEAEYDQQRLVGFTPKGSVEGHCRLDGRKVVLSAGDFTVRGGSGGASSGSIGLEPRSALRALEFRRPYVRLLDAAGGSVRSFETMGRTYLPDGNAWTTTEIRLLSRVPVVSAVLGSVAGLPAVQAPMSHFSVMVKGISQLFPGGPPVVKAALGVDITKEELGGDHIHTRKSGVVDNLAADEYEAFDMIRRFLGYLPSNVWEVPARGECSDPSDRADEELLSFMPRDRRKIYNAHRLIRHIVDKDSFFELSALYGRARVTGLARLNGYPVAIMANNPKFNGGSTDVAAGDKVIRLLQLCDIFHLPLVSLADEPGFMVGLDSELRGIERAGARLVSYVCESRMPWLTIVTGKLYGVAGQCHHRPDGAFRRYCWPSANWGSMHIAGGASAAYRREIETADDPQAKQQEIEARLNALSSPFRTAEATGQDIIDPRRTRALACEFVEDVQDILKTQVGLPPYPYRP